MDIRKRKVKGIYVLSVLIILCLCLASVMNMFVSERKANALIAGASTTNIGELLLDNYATRADKMVFNGDNLSILYQKLTRTANYEEFKKIAADTLNSDDFRTNNDGQDVTVQINELLWNVAYLSTNRQGDPIVTLWLANSKQLSDKGYSATAQWNGYSSTSNGSYPSNMYGTSLIRVKALNNGGKYATSISELSTDEMPQDPNNAFAIYT
ncbi:MAG: hypothetical protein K2N32_01965, partial [Clostridia bacterium]|nr:hypothetical protein [Clostridia bacterium]